MIIEFLSLTPGLISKVRGRIAEVVGSSISENLMNKELRAIVWLGALLGGIIGTINSMF